MLTISRVMRILTTVSAAFSIFLALFFVAVCRLNAAAPAPDDINVQARLVWGSNDQKPKEPDYKEVDPKLAETLRKVLKWKNYYECSRTNMNVALNQTKRVRVSAKCEFEMTYLGGSRAQTKLLGKGTVVDQRTQQISYEPLILGGPDKNDTAWFVIITKTKSP